MRNDVKCFELRATATSPRFRRSSLKGDVISDAFYAACRNGQTGVAAVLLPRGRTLIDHQFASTPEGWAAEGQHDDIRELLRRGYGRLDG